jgi:hypothetical protein
MVRPPCAEAESVLVFQQQAMVSSFKNGITPFRQWTPRRAELLLRCLAPNHSVLKEGMQTMFDFDRYRRVVLEYEHKWQPIDVALYDLCRRYPGHTDAGGLNAKVWIIGRTYATGIERKIPTKRAQGSSLSQLSEHLLTNGKTLENWFARLRAIKEPLSAGNLRIILAVHGSFVNLIKKIRGVKQTPRSFGLLPVLWST